MNSIYLAAMAMWLARCPLCAPSPWVFNPLYRYVETTQCPADCKASSHKHEPLMTMHIGFRCGHKYLKEDAQAWRPVRPQETHPTAGGQ